MTLLIVQPNTLFSYFFQSMIKIEKDLELVKFTSFINTVNFKL